MHDWWLRRVPEQANEKVISSDAVQFWICRYDAKQWQIDSNCVLLASQTCLSCKNRSRVLKQCLIRWGACPGLQALSHEVHGTAWCHHV